MALSSSQLSSPITLAKVLRARFGTASNVAGARPFLTTGTTHFAYALHRIAGCDRRTACRDTAAFLGKPEPIPMETARWWESELRRAVGAYLGRSVTYEFAARWAVDETLRQETEAPPEDAEEEPA